MDDTQLSLALYVNKASELAEQVRHDIQHNNGTITEKTVKVLNAFIIAANMIKDLTSTINSSQIN